VAIQRAVHHKPEVFRRAVVSGALSLSPKTVRAIRARRVEKGDPLAAGELAGLLAIKRTPELIPHCHPIPITGSSVRLTLGSSGVQARVEVEAIYRTGVEMEALVGATVALLTVWDMVKYSEKDAGGQYPSTRLGPVKVVSKQKSRRGPRA
jgi:cyclic pyranopterin monophosphate synthase